MKTLKLISIIGFLILFSSCLDDNDSDPLYRELGVVEGHVFGFTIKTDQGNVLDPGDIHSENYTPTHGDRVLLQYYVNDEKELSSDIVDYMIDLQYLAKIDVDNIYHLNEGDSIEHFGEDNIFDLQLSGGQSFLNLEFTYIKADKNEFALIYNPDEQKDDGNIRLDLRHKSEGEGKDQVYTIKSFPIDEFLDTEEDYVSIIVYATDRYGSVINKQIQYYVDFTDN
ncbi:NigD-like C-terminal domain-containing protein [Marinilabiliaceae bacterium ANBcel2]|nr:NigD-like C-terminal domain-containing protein [Marinilabiliaceae bacterium ANBcel2]